MLRFFRKCCSQSATRVNTPKKLNVHVEAVAIEIPRKRFWQETGKTIIHSKKKRTFNNIDNDIKLGIEYLKRSQQMPKVLQTYYDITIANDFASWSLVELHELSSFFAKFIFFPIQIKLDAARFLSLPDDKFKKLLHVFSSIPQNLTLLLSYNANDKTIPMNEQQLMNIQTYLPGRIIKKGKHRFDPDSTTLLHSLIYTLTEDIIYLSNDRKCIIQ